MKLPTRRPWLALLPAGLAAGGGALALVVTSNHETDIVGSSILGLLLGWTFIGTGLYGWARRPDNGTGRLMVAVGFAWFLGAAGYANASIPYTIGIAVGALPLAVFIHLLFAFPNGRVEGKWQRRIVIAAYPTALLATTVSLLVDSTPDDGCDGCPANAFLVVDSDSAASVLVLVGNLVGVAFMLATAVVLVKRWRAATAPARRVLAPVYVGGFVSVLLVGLSLALDPVTDFSNVVGTLGILSFVSVPFFFLAGLLRTRLARVGAAQLLQETPERQSYEEAEAGLRRALNDPTLRLLVRDDERGGYVDSGGRATEVPDESEVVAVSGSRTRASRSPPSSTTRRSARSPSCWTTCSQRRGSRSSRIAASRPFARASDATARSSTRCRTTCSGSAATGPSSTSTRTGRTRCTLPPDRIIGSRIGEHVTTGDAAARLETIGRVIATGRTETFELESLDRSGRISQREMRMVKSGEDEVLAISRDIADRKRAEQELVRQRDFLSTVVNTATSIFCVVTPTGEIMRFNEFCIALTGRADDDHARGLLFWDLFAAPEDVEAMRAAFEADVAGLEHEHRWLPSRASVAWSPGRPPRSSTRKASNGGSSTAPT